ncbi:TRAP transporter small permease [Fonticella tunisiensis]|uniref:C4-dicarboxylate transporter DctQ subunit n=1 Tax=Fonticella tunisiensis TaxID=1096341 RepID=A0A4R7KRJ4_9CLOT|nr:TRAP transporter small permease [Fonticella tunisiensis]TDT61907.1 C4-dicarboxylate transporter DctQ subunit [Fonticella tunisiensis]
MRRILRSLNNIEEYLIIGLLSVMTVVVVVQVICRFIFKFSLTWSEELARYILVWTTFIGASMGIKRGAHIGIEAFTLLLPEKFRKYVAAFGYILCAIFTIIVFKESSRIIHKQILNHQISPAMGMPMWLAYLALPVGTFLMTLRFGQALFELFKPDKDISAQQRASKEV